MEVRPGYKQTEAGLIPCDWLVRPVGLMGEVVTGKALAVNAPGEQRPYLRTKNVFDGRIDIDDVQKMPMTDVQFRQFMLRNGDVLLNEGQSLELVGRCALYQDEYPEPCAIQNQLLRFRARQGVSGVFASHLFRHCQQTGVFARVALQTTSIAHLGGKRFEQLLLQWPSTEDEQHAIATALSDADALLGGLDRLIAKKHDLKQAAMQQLLTGQMRLPGFRGEWEVKRLGEAGTFLKGSGVKKDEANSGDLPCIRYGEIYTHHNDYIRSFNSWISSKVAATATRLRQGDLLFAGSGETKEEIGKCVAFVDDLEAFAGGDIVILRLAGANPMFMGYYCNTAPINAQKASKGQGDAVVHISAAALSSVEVALPPEDEQTAIAAVLSDMDAELTALEARRDKIRDLKQAMMQELLTGRTRLISHDATGTEVKA
jgi:type I restriction enzyme, S subunit